MDNGLTSVKVDNISYRTTESELRDLFGRYGSIGDIYIPRMRETGESRGFAFVRYYDVRDAEDATEKLDKYEVDGRPLRCQIAKYARNEPRRGGGGGGRDRGYDRGYDRRGGGGRDYDRGYDRRGGGGGRDYYDRGRDDRRDRDYGRDRDDDRRDRRDYDDRRGDDRDREPPARTDDGGHDTREAPDTRSEPADYDRDAPAPPPEAGETRGDRAPIDEPPRDD